MDLISPEMDSLTPKTPDYMYHTPCFIKKRYILQYVGRHLAAILEFRQ